MAVVQPLSYETTYGDLEITVTPVAISLQTGIALVDAGPPGALPALAGALQREGLDIDDLRLVVCTHHDGDHVGAIPALLDRTDSSPTVLAHEAEVPFLSGDREPLKPRQPIDPTPVDVTIADGMTLQSTVGPVRIVATPGHSPGHVSLYHAQSRTLLAGDALVADGDEPVDGPRPEFTPDEPHALASVARLAELDIERTICFHGGETSAGTAAIRELVP